MYYFSSTILFKKIGADVNIGLTVVKLESVSLQPAIENGFLG